MKAMQDKELDKIFKDHFENMELSPSAKLWDNIAEQLDSAPTVKMRKFPYWSVAAAVLVGISVSWWLLTPSKTIQLYQENQALATVVSNKVQPTSSKTTEKTSSQQFLNRVAQVRTDQKQHTQKVKTLNTKWKESRERLADNIHQLQYAEVPSVVISAASGEKEAIPTLNIEQQLTRQSVVYADANQRSGVNKESQQNTGIRNMGDVINFLVGKLDKRKNKIIQFSTTEEGSMVSAINIGPLRYKTDTNN